MYGAIMALQAGVGVVSLLAYVFIIGVLFRRPQEFSNAYYRIVKYGGLVDIFVYLWDWLFSRLLEVPFFGSFYRTLFHYIPWLAEFFWILNTLCFHAAQVQLFLPGVQRVYLLAMPIFADVSFRKIVDRFFLVLPVYCLIVSVPIVAFQPTVKVELTEIGFNMTHPLGTAYYFAVFAVIYVFISLIILLISIVYLIKYNNALNAIRRLFFISFFIGVTRFLVLALETLSVLNEYAGWSWGSWISDVALSLTLDLTLLATPWLHMAFNRPMQRRLLVIVGIKEENQVQIALPITNAQRK